MHAYNAVYLIDFLLQLHLREFNRTRFSAVDPKFLPDEGEEVSATASVPNTNTDTTEEVFNINSPSSSGYQHFKDLDSDGEGSEKQS